MGLTASPSVKCGSYGADGLSLSRMCAPGDLRLHPHPNVGVRMLAPSPTSFSATVKTLRVRGVVIVDLSDYLSDIKIILNDSWSFRKIETDTGSLWEVRLITHSQRMNNGKFISEEEYSLARPANATPVRIYDLPKLTRPVVLVGQSSRQRRRWATAWVKHWPDDRIIFDAHHTWWKTYAIISSFSIHHSINSRPVISRMSHQLQR